MNDVDGKVDFVTKSGASDSNSQLLKVFVF